MKDYLSAIVDLTSDPYISPTGVAYGDGTGAHQRAERIITSIAVHHDASVRPHNYDSIARYRSEAAEHYKRLGPGLQYHYKIDNTGVIFKTRPHTTWLYALGSQANVVSINICLDGYFHPPHNQRPTREQYEALKQLLDWLCTQNPQFPAAQKDVYPHGHFSPTACCGELLVPFVDAYRNTGGNVAIPDVPYDWPEFQPAQQSTQTPETPIVTAHTPELQPPVVPEEQPVGQTPTTSPGAELSSEPVDTSEPQPSDVPSPDVLPTTEQPQSIVVPSQPVPEEPQPEPVSKLSLMSFLTLLYRKIILQNVRGINMKLGKYNKAVVAAVGFVLGGLGFVLGLDSPLYFALVQMATVLGVYRVPNKAN